MTGNAFRIGRILGIDIRLDLSWFIIFVLISWSLADHYFPTAHPGWTAGAYWLLATVTSLLFFTSVLTHELAHSVVSGAFGVPVRDITLFIFGGAAHISREPKQARDELLMAIAGPATSLALAAAFGSIWWLTQGSNDAIHALAGWLARINAILGLFNLIPGFPLDGGRVLRAIVWRATGDLKRATQIAGGAGRLVAYGFMLWGTLQIFDGLWADGLWMVFIGWFLLNAATQSVQQLGLQEVLAGHTVREVMMTDCPHVLRRLTLDVLVDHVVLPSGRRCFPVVEDGDLHGLITLHQIKEVPRERWPHTRVGDVMIPRATLKTVLPEDGLEAVLERMGEEGVNQLPVVENGRLVGMVTRENLLNFIQLRVEMEKQAA